MSKSASPFTVVLLFTVAYAVTVLGVGIAPINMLMGRYMTSAVAEIWANSLGRLALRSAEAGVACWMVLLVTGRARGRLTSKGMLAVGALAAGVLAGAADVLLHNRMVHTLVAAARTAPLAGESLSLAITVGVVAVITLLVIVRDVRPVPAAR